MQDDSSRPIRSFLIVLALWAAGLGAAAQFAKLGVPLAELRAAYPGHGASIGFLVSVISLLGILLGLVTGALTARIGARPMVIGALLLGGGLSFLQALMLPFPVMLLTRIAEGLSHLGIVIAAPTLIGTLTPARHRGAAMAFWSTFFGVAFAVVAWAGMPLVAARGLPTLFAAHAVWMVALAGLLAAVLPRAGVRVPDTLPPARRGILRRHRDAYGSAFTAAPAAGWLFYTLIFVALLTVLPPLAGPAGRGLLAGTMPLASIAVSLTLGLGLLRLMPAVRVTILGFALSLGLALALIADPGAAWSGVALFGALGLVQGASFAAIPQLNPTPAAQALANGAMAQMGNLGNVAGTPILLAALDLGGPRAMIGVVALCCALGMLTHLGMARRRRRAAG